MTTVATANIGDASLPLLRATLTTIRDTLPAPFALCLQEVTNADEREVIAEVFDGYTIVGARTRCPIVVSPGVETGEVAINGTSAGIHRQSPPRVAVDVYLPKTNTAILGGHFPRAFNAPKTLPARAALIKAWWVHRRGMRDRARYHRQLGHNVIWATDVNVRWKRPKVSRLEVPVAHKGLDWVRAIPTAGRRVRVRDHGVIDMRIEPWHDCVWATVQFTKEKEKQ